MIIKINSKKSFSIPLDQLIAPPNPLDNFPFEGIEFALSIDNIILEPPREDLPIGQFEFALAMSPIAIEFTFITEPVIIHGTEISVIVTTLNEFHILIEDPPLPMELIPPPHALIGHLAV